ncbi:MAG: lysophospholipid acyltransferase family protein [Candidatus Omnitrophota bacterium]
MFYRISRFIFKVFLYIFFKIRFFGKENIPDRPYIVAANHASLIDPPLVGVACEKDDVDFMAKEELFNAPILGLWTRSVGCIKVRRGANSVKSLKEALRRVNNGRVVSVFPEGTRSSDGSLQSAKRGIGFLIARANVPVVPIYIQNSAQAMPKSGGIKPGVTINIFIGKPILPDDFKSSEDSSKRDYEKVSNIVMEHISALVK